MFRANVVFPYQPPDLRPPPPTSWLLDCPTAAWIALHHYLNFIAFIWKNSIQTPYDIGLQLLLAGVEDKLLPERFLLANVFAKDRMFDGEIGSYWPALVIDQFSVTSRVHRRQEAAGTINRTTPPKEEYLVWLIGRNKFFWIERSHLRELHECQLEAIRNADDEEKLTSLIKIGLKQSTKKIFKFSEIKFWTTRRASMVVILIPGASLGSKVSYPRLKRSVEDSPSGRNLRTRIGGLFTSARSSTSSSFTPTGLAKDPSASFSVDTGRTPIVKQEPNGDDLLPRKERVQIIVELINTEFTCSQKNIAKSPVLSSYAVEQPGQHPFIMNPASKDICPNDFSCVINFLRTNTYAPALVEAPANHSDLRKYILEELAREWEYSSDADDCTCWRKASSCHLWESMST